MEKKEPCERNRSGVEVTQMDLSHQESSEMFRDMALSSLFLWLKNSGMAGPLQRTGEQGAWQVSYKGKKKAKGWAA